MTHGGTGRRIHIRVTGDDPRYLEALHSWLSLEDWFERAEAAGELTVVYREGNGTERTTHPDGPPMGSGITELVLVFTSAALGPVFKDLYAMVKTAARAWADNGSSDHHRIDVDVSAGPGDSGPDGTGPDRPDTDPGDGDDRRNR